MELFKGYDVILPFLRIYLLLKPLNVHKFNQIIQKASYTIISHLLNHS